ncbi:MAG: DUF3782 domain-containing protein, partial [Methylococcales bacterium]|nr:DUF3782 domain-containing protein [Methylococcales bacterium]
MQAAVQTSPSYDDILRLFQETTLRFQETDRIIKQMAKDTSREIKAVNASIGRLSNRLGEFVEEAVRPAAVRLF